MDDPKVVAFARYDKALKDKAEASRIVSAADEELREMDRWMTGALDLNECWVMGDTAFIKDTSLKVRRVRVVYVGNSPSA